MPDVQTIVPKKTETAADKFQRLANKRTNAALQKISLIGNLSSGQYAKTEEQIRKIEAALYSAVDNMVSRFAKTSDDKPSFQL